MHLHSKIIDKIKTYDSHKTPSKKTERDCPNFFLNLDVFINEKDYFSGHKTFSRSRSDIDRRSFYKTIVSSIVML